MAALLGARPLLAAATLACLAAGCASERPALRPLRSDVQIPYTSAAAQTSARLEGKATARLHLNQPSVLSARRSETSASEKTAKPGRVLHPALPVPR